MKEQLRVAMPFYTLAIIPLIQNLPDIVKQEWYADDASACGELQGLCDWWNRLSQLGPLYGYSRILRKLG